MTGRPTMWERVEETASLVRGLCDPVPDTAIVLGSGLGEFADTVADPVTIPYSVLPFWPVPAVAGHAGTLVVGSAAGRRVAVLSGRVHLYEGHDSAAVVFATRVMGRLGVKKIVLTNAAGGINTTFAQGELMVIDDHINLTGMNPLVGPNDDRFGTRFPDMSEVYSADLRAIADAAAAAQGIHLAHGIYAGLLGPSYETPAEIRFLRAAGADAVGMSTVSEAIAARHMGLQVLGLSCITNMAAGVLPRPIVHDDVMETAHRVRDAFIALLGGILERI